MRILVIEDNEKHLSDAKRYGAELNGVAIDFATNLKDATALLKKNTYDSIISDVFFPAKAGGSAESFENALTINNRLRELGIHHVFNTSGNHHGQRYEGFLHKTPVCDHDIPSFLWSGMVIESYPLDSNAEKDSKQWSAAYRYVILVHEMKKLPDLGRAVIAECAEQMKDFTYGDGGDLTRRLNWCANAWVIELFLEKYNA